MSVIIKKGKFDAKERGEYRFSFPLTMDLQKEMEYWTLKKIGKALIEQADITFGEVELLSITFQTKQVKR